MVALTSLWLPILLSAVIVFVASSIIHMFLRTHHSDWSQLPDEEKVLTAMREAGVGPGQYTFPYASSTEEMRSPEMAEKLERGPVGFLIARSGPPVMVKNLVQWFAYCVLVGVFVAYVAATTLAEGTDYMHVFQVAGTAAILAYAGALPIRSIWFAHSWSSTLKEVLDGVVYGLLTAGTFGALWPR